MKRAAGILLHVTSIPGQGHLGDLGPAAHAWLEWLAGAGCSLWQILPLGPVGHGNSPYQSYSAFAGEALLISLEDLAREGLLQEEDLPAPEPARGAVDYGAANAEKWPALERAAQRFIAGAADSLAPAYEAFRQQADPWLEDYVLFKALKEASGEQAWWEWDPPLAQRDAQALDEARVHLAARLEIHRRVQFLFFHQWAKLKEKAAEMGVQIIGDLPIFVAHDSADVWAHQDLFHLDKHGQPTVVAGVPPDYFSASGQLWGNPLYRWDRLAQEGYTWWIARMRHWLDHVDVIRLDHFRGFQAYWEIPANAHSAAAGRWVEGPGEDLLRVMQEALGSLPILAEDLGVITPQVKALREAFGLPGMRVLQFGFEGGPQNDHLPHHYPERCAAYTGTHDNDTSRGWFAQASEDVRDFCLQYLDSEEAQVHWAMLRGIWSSVARWAIVPLQDPLGLGSEGRMNWPGRAEGNWAWRCPAGALTDELAARIRHLNWLFDRLSAERTEGDT
jgi:4-alpha-glucanotransferase